MKGFLKWTLIIFAGLMVIGIIAGDPDEPSRQPTVPSAVQKQAGPETRSATKEEAAKPGLEVLEYDSERDEYGNLFVTGTVKNNTSRKYSYAQVSINLYDESGAQIGSTLDNVNNVAPGGTWKFRAMVLEKSARRFSVEEVTGW